ncbi:M28 family peptidase [candidate division KSB1 bacterium]|nr:M28 family peptidase [candidate division KSB1 bacterium]
MLPSVTCTGQSVPTFNGDRAYSYLKKQCDFGPRTPGSDAHKQCLNYLVSELRTCADQVVQQPFQHPIRPGQPSVQLANVIANFQLTNPNRILLCAHWDTRPWADQDIDKTKRSQPVVGANDGASGVAVLLEIARLLKQQPPRVGVDIVLFDAEDFGSYGDNESWALGAKIFAERKNRNYNPRFGILLDMIGDADQQIFIEQNSQYYAPDIVSLVWNTAERLGVSTFIPDARFEVMDDHMRLLQVGIQCIDLIDFDYPYWHTTEDTPDKCSAESLANIGRVVTTVVYEQ